MTRCPRQVASNTARAMQTADGPLMQSELLGDAQEQMAELNQAVRALSDPLTRMGVVYAALKVCASRVQ